MKVCPTCKMTVKDEGECRFCHTSITYEPDVNSDREQYVFNKYLLLYLLKHSWFSLFCLIIVLLATDIYETCVQHGFFACCIPYLRISRHLSLPKKNSFMVIMDIF